MSAPLEGGCACGAVRYRVMAAPLFVHCCHCLNCQRQTGSAFVINLLIEADRVRLLADNALGIFDDEQYPAGRAVDRARAEALHLR